MDKSNVRFIPRLNPDLELKKLGTIMGLSIYVDMSGTPPPDDERKFNDFIVIQKMLADFFNPPTLTKED